MPKHWFSMPLHQSMRTCVRPPTKRTRRKEQRIETRIPLGVFVDLMQPMETGDMQGFEWANASKTKLKPTKDTKSVEHYKYTINMPAKVGTFWGLERTEVPRRVRQGGKLVRRRRGLGSSRLHLLVGLGRMF